MSIYHILSITLVLFLTNTPYIIGSYNLRSYYLKNHNNQQSSSKSTEKGKPFVEHVVRTRKASAPRQRADWFVWTIRRTSPTGPSILKVLWLRRLPTIRVVTSLSAFVVIFFMLFWLYNSNFCLYIYIFISFAYLHVSNLVLLKSCRLGSLTFIYIHIIWSNLFI